MESGAAHAGAIAVIGAVIFDLAHAFDTAGHHDIGRARGHPHRRIDHRLQARSAAPVERDARHGFGKARRQPRPTRHAGRFAVGVAVREHHVVHAFRIDLRALHQRLQDDRAQFAGRKARQRPAKTANPGANGGNNCSPAHQFFSRIMALAMIVCWIWLVPS